MVKKKKLKCYFIFSGFYEDNEKAMALAYKTKKLAIKSFRDMHKIKPLDDDVLIYSGELEEV